MFPAEKPALLNNIAQGTIGYQVPAGSVSFLEFLDEKTLNHIAENATTKFWNGFMKFGSASGGIAGIIVFLTVIKLAIDTCVQGYALHALYGWSIHLLGAIWGSLTGLLLTLAHQKNKLAPKKEEAHIESG